MNGDLIKNSDEEVECFLDPDNEVFFGPVTEREREIRRPLPRKTLHPCEVAQISKRGMTFIEWENLKDQYHRNQLNDEAIKEVYGVDPDSTEESFNSCQAGEGGSKHGCSDVESVCHSLEALEQTLGESNTEKSQQEVSMVGSLNDTWEIQERMLALAEKLERGEDVPELGICQHASGAVEYTELRSSIGQSGDSIETYLSGKHIEEDREAHEKGKEALEKREREREEDTSNRGQIESDISVSSLNDVSSIVIGLQDKKTKSVEELAKEMDCLFLVETLVETPVKKALPKCNDRATPSVAGSYFSSHIVPETPIKTPSGLSIKHRSTPIPSDSMKKPGVKPYGKSKNSFVASSPVGMYIRSLPEPMLIENVRSVQKKKQINSSPMIKPVPVAVKNKDGRWSVAKEPRNSSADEKKENVIQSITDYTDIKPVLPTVLHEAAATLIDERSTTSPCNTPGTRGKIGKLLDRGVTPTVMKHNGRIQISKDSVNSSQIIQSPMARLGASSNLMEVSVLENVGSSSSRRNLKPAASTRK